LTSILVIEDDARTRKMLRAQFEAEGFSVDEAEDGVGGIANVASHCPQLVLVDIFMPNMDGLETIAELRRRWCDLPIIAMSAGGALSQGDVLEIAKEMGASAVLTKPFSMRSVVDAVRTLLG
jgi:DNA-binding response OmpR family regulator